MPGGAIFLIAFPSMIGCFVWSIAGAIKTHEYEKGDNKIQLIIPEILGVAPIFIYILWGLFLFAMFVCDADIF